MHPTPCPFEQRLARVLAHCERRRSAITVLHFDIDGYDEWIETHGHLGGIALQRVLHRAVRDLLRPGDECNRYGDGHTLWVLPATPLQSGLELAARARLRLQAHRFDATVSIAAVQTGPGHYAGAAALMHEAHRLLAASRATARGRTLGAQVPDPLPDARLPA